jgi:uncharacterized membrane protein
METTSSNNHLEAGKSNAIIAYLTLIGFIIALVLNNDKKYAFTSFHIRQSLGLICTGFALGLINIIPIIGWIIGLLGTIVIIVFWVMGLLSAINGQEKPVPVLGEHYQKWFSSL